MKQESVVKESDNRGGTPALIAEITIRGVDAPRVRRHLMSM